MAQTAPLSVTDLSALIRDVPDFPKPGIVFKDITPLLADPAGLALAVECLAQPFRRMNIDKVVGAESRGFIFGTAVAQSLSAGFVPVRKPDKLPRKTISRTYELEYGQNALHLHDDAISEGESILLVDDLLATGGTVAACGELVESLGGRIAGIAFLIELAFLNGRSRIAKYPVHAVLSYDS
ncbi:MAG: adenine phosphoribosyltransferase [Phycisphaerales bacterium]|nr:adenine phosphoribosyltransferase [Phycisphaerales bacterium]